MAIQKQEYQHRQSLLCQALADRGLKGVVVVSRGGYTYDRAYDVLYLTGYYQSYVYMPANVPHWSGRGHTALVMNADGRTTLCVSTPDSRKNGTRVDDIAFGGDFDATLAGAMAALDLGDGPVGLIGSDVLPSCNWRRLAAQCPDVRWEDVDDAIAALKLIKSDAEQECIRTVCAVNRRAVDAFRQTLRPGVTEAEAVAAAYAVAAREGAAIPFCAVASGEHAFAYTSNSHPGFSKRVLCPGDMVKIDLGVLMDGYLSEFGRTYIVGQASADQRRLLDTLHSALDSVLHIIKPGLPVGDLVAHGDAALDSLGVVAAGTAAEGQISGSYPVLWGHGLGLGFERPWLIAGEELCIQAGMCLAVEKFLTLEPFGTAAAEQNLLVNEEGVEILTAGGEDPWA